MIKDVIFYKSANREFRSDFQLGEAKKILRETFVSPQTGLNRDEGIIGELIGDKIKMAYMYPNLKNSWYSVFVGRLEEIDSGSRLVGHYTRSAFIKVATLFIILFVCSCISIFILNMVIFGYTQRGLLIGCAIPVWFLFYFLMEHFCVALSRKDEMKIDSIIEVVLDCKVSITPK